MGPVLDSSFVSKLYLPEPDTAAAMALFVSFPETPVISVLTDVEVASAILRKSTGLNAPTLYAAYRLNRDSGAYQVVHADAQTYVLARQLVERYVRLFSLRSLDAVQLATALQIGAREFVTLDADLTKAAEAEGLTVPRI